MIQVGTHTDYETPPNVPMFGMTGNSKSTKSTNLTEALSSIAEGFIHAWKVPAQPPCCSPKSDSDNNTTLQEKGISPVKCSKLRSKCIEQLNELLELTAIITKDEYEQQKKTILDKMK